MIFDCEHEWPIPQGTTCKVKCQRGFLFRPQGQDALFENGPSVKCRCKSKKCKVQRPRGRCVVDPESLENPVTTIAPVACLRLKPPLTEGFELDGPCVFPLEPGAECKVKCPKGTGWGKCVCRQDEFGRADSDAIDYLNGPSCDFRLPTVCSASTTTDNIGCSSSGEFGGFSVVCDRSQGELVGPSTSCPMTCHGSANDDLRAICRCHDENECEWVPKTSCNELAPECDDPSTIDFGAGLSVFCSEEVRRKMLSRPKRSSMACQVTCADDAIFSGKPPKCKCKKQTCKWGKLKGKCESDSSNDSGATSCPAKLRETISHLECTLTVMSVGAVFTVASGGSVPAGASCRVACADEFATWSGQQAVCSCSKKNKCKLKLKGECGLGKSAL